MQLRTDRQLPIDQVVALYQSVGWHNYAREPEALARAIENSTYVVSIWEGGLLVGLARGLSDDVSIFYLQDILVHPDHQRKGVGRRLLTSCLQRFRHVRQKALITDNSPAQLRFYEGMGFHNLRELRRYRLNAFIQFNDLELE